MKIIHTIASTRDDHGGTSRSVPALCDALVHHDCDVHLVTTVSPGQRCNLPAPPVCTNVIEVPRRFPNARLGRAFQHQLRAIVRQESDAVIVHDHGLWLPSNHAVAAFCRSHKIRRVVSARGMLAPWSMRNGRLKKKLPWMLYQRKDLDTAAAFHATSDLEAEDIRALGFKQPIAVIANGVENPGRVYRFTVEKRRVLFLSRIHPKKGLRNLVSAWKKATLSGDWELVIAGPDENNHRGEIEREIRELALDDRIHLWGPVDDQDKWDLYRSADAFILPSYSENFGIVVAEAMSAGLPVIATRGTPWSGLVERRCGWWIAPSVDAISDALKEMASLDRRVLEEMGNRGRVWAESSFRWNAIGQQMASFYRWIAAVEDRRPNFEVHI